MLPDIERAKRALVALSIEKALLDIGKPTYDKVVKSLNTRYHCHLPDCYEHPEYFTEILKELYGNAHRIIVKSINIELEEYSRSRQIAKFLKVISK